MSEPVHAPCELRYRHFGEERCGIDCRACSHCADRALVNPLTGLSRAQTAKMKRVCAEAIVGAESRLAKS